MRQPVAPHFYPGDVAAQVNEYLVDFEPPDEPEQPIGGLVPHAGWIYSGSIAARVIKCLEQARPETFVLFGAVHSWSVQPGAVYATGGWETPAGEARVDEELARRLVEACPDHLTIDPASHAQEHSIEVQLPIIKVLYPEAKIVPIAMPPTPTAHEMGRAIGRVLAKADRRVAVLGSTDLTHYGPNYGFAPWGSGAEAREKMYHNDRRIIDLILALHGDRVVAETDARSNACGGGAIAATVAAVTELGAEGGALIEYTTSHDVMKEPPDSFQTAVGYAGIIFG